MKNVGDQPPDFAVTNARRIELEHGNKSRREPGQCEYERGEADEDARQTRNRDETESAFEFVEPGHVRAESSASVSLVKQNRSQVGRLRYSFASLACRT